MPLYEYRCETCGATEEHVQKLADPPMTECAACKGPLKKLLAAAAFHLKGGGWYKDGYASTKPGGDSSGISGGDGGKASSSSDSGGTSSSGSTSAGTSSGSSTPSGSGTSSSSGASSGSSTSSSSSPSSSSSSTKTKTKE